MPLGQLRPPSDLPLAPDSGVIGAIAYQNGSGGRYDRAFQGTKLEMAEGLYNYGNLNGLHDSISSLKVMPGFAAALYKDVSGGVPQGRMEVIEGPDQIPELRQDRRTRGLENEISAIEVWRVEAGNRLDPTGRTPTPPPPATPPIADPGPSEPFPTDPRYPFPELPPPSDQPGNQQGDQQGDQKEAGLGTNQTLLIAGGIVAAALLYTQQ